ncbi:hypothetical protein WS62_29625 [Burkholderia sp. ABCPW 14]|nr:hypothetical protein WS62_29625 [Burkholderia sp. ABCPW 14]
MNGTARHADVMSGKWRRRSTLPRRLRFVAMSSSGADGLALTLRARPMRRRDDTRAFHIRSGVIRKRYDAVRVSSGGL